VFVAMHVFDGMFYPSAGSTDFDASAYTRVDAYTVNFSRMKDGKVVQTGTQVVSQDGRTWTESTTGIDANGRQVNNINVLTSGRPSMGLTIPETLLATADEVIQ
jgi:hypothetical protein